MALHYGYRAICVGPVVLVLVSCLIVRSRAALAGACATAGDVVSSQSAIRLLAEDRRGAGLTARYAPNCRGFRKWTFVSRVFPTGGLRR